jgi:hypothetical protein
MIAVDATDGALLGLVHAKFLRRTGGKKALCGKRPFEEKESRRRLNATNSPAASKLISNDAGWSAASTRCPTKSSSGAAFSVWQTGSQ